MYEKKDDKKKSLCEKKTRAKKRKNARLLGSHISILHNIINLSYWKNFVKGQFTLTIAELLQ